MYDDTRCFILRVHLAYDLVTLVTNILLASSAVVHKVFERKKSRGIAEEARSDSSSSCPSSCSMRSSPLSLTLLQMVLKAERRGVAAAYVLM